MRIRYDSDEENALPGSNQNMARENTRFLDPFLDTNRNTHRSITLSSDQSSSSSDTEQETDASQDEERDGTTSNGVLGAQNSLPVRRSKRVKQVHFDDIVSPSWTKRPFIAPTTRKRAQTPAGSDAISASRALSSKVVKMGSKTAPKPASNR